MGSQGADLMMSSAAYKAFPYSVECKNQEKFTTLYKFYQQSVDQEDSYEPLLVIKQNHKKPLVVIDAEAFMDIILGPPCQDEQD